MNSINRSSSELNTDQVLLNSAVPGGAGKKPVKSGKSSGDIRADDAVHDGATVGAHLADKLDDSPALEKLSAFIGSAMVVSGLKEARVGIIEKDKMKFLRGSKRLMWGVYCGANTLEKAFKLSLFLTPGLRILGGLINADLGLSALHKDFKDDGKLNDEKAVFHGAATAWGLRHAILGAKKIAEKLAISVPLLGPAAAAMALAGGSLDAALGVRLFSKGVKTGNKEMKILGAIDVGVGIAIMSSCLLAGIPGMAAGAIGGAGIIYRSWRTDKKQIKNTLITIKNKTKLLTNKIKKKFVHK